MTITLTFLGGPLDGETRDLDTPPDGQVITVQGAAYRVTVYDNLAAVGWAEHVTTPGTVPWTWNRRRGTWERGDVIPSGSPLRVGEAVLCILVFATAGLILVLAAGAWVLIGNAIAWLASAVGGWIQLGAITAGALAIAGTLGAVVNPDLVREASS